MTFIFLAPRMRWLLVLLLIIGVTAFSAIGADGEGSAHDSMDHNQYSPVGANGTPTLSGEYAFATISEIALLLRSDGATDWSTVDLTVLREHLVDMHHVTISASVTVELIDGGARFDVTSQDTRVTDAIRRMVSAHATVMSVSEGSDTWRFSSNPITGGAQVTVQGETTEGQSMIRALGFHGVMAEGDHHRHHHWLLATGKNPH